MNVPPLGTYDIKGMDKFGYYTNSKFRNTCATLFSPPKSNISPNNSTPGPGDYLLPGSMNTNGVYHVSGFKTKIGFSMGYKSIPNR